MNVLNGIAVTLASALLAVLLMVPSAPACCPAPPRGKPVVNADQTVIMVWDAERKTQHFIRQASFKSNADDFGFLVPTPTQPELAESGNDAFPHLLKLTEPEVQEVRQSGGTGCTGIGCGSAAPKAATLGGTVRVLDEKKVAGFNAAVLEATSAEALTAWLKQHDYAYSPEIAVWAKPYIDNNWKITALKVARDNTVSDPTTVAASALRLSFKTDRPVFPYREPDPKADAAQVGATSRLLRIYFIADGRYRGDFDGGGSWTGKVAWSGQVSAEDRKKSLEKLGMPQDTGPAQWWLTEFEDNWPYRAAPSDVFFSRDTDQNTVKRPPIIRYVSAPLPTDATVYAIAVVLIVPPLYRRYRNRHQR